MQLNSERKAIVGKRIELLSKTLGKPVSATGNDLEPSLRFIDAGDLSEVWLALALVSGRLPSDAEVRQIARLAQRDIDTLLGSALGLATAESLAFDVEVVEGAIVTDVRNSSNSPFTTGIQRVVRECSARWAHDPQLVFVSWSETLDFMRTLNHREYELLLGRKRSSISTTGKAKIIVPWCSLYFIPELAAEPDRTKRIRALSRYSRNQVATIGYDLIPLLSPETSSPGMPGFYAETMTALRYADLIIPISHSAATEYLGWRKTLAAIGVTGPSVEPVVLAVDSSDATDSAVQQAADLLVEPGTSLVLAVGSHEPRKNHEAILFAAETLWREGIDFSLAFIGGNSWSSDRFYDKAADLQQQGRPIVLVDRADDTLLWAAYRAARFTVFPSLQEGFGLPIAESLSVGTPVITSNYGSMAEIAVDGGGCLLVDPRNDAELITAMKRLLLDDELWQQLHEETLQRKNKSWDRYAEEVLQKLRELQTSTDVSNGKRVASLPTELVDKTTN